MNELNFLSKQIYWPRGKMLGGSDSFGHLVYVRGNPRDFDEWAVNGCKGWSYEEVLPYFIKSENNKNAYYKQSGLIICRRRVTTLSMYKIFRK